MNAHALNQKEAARLDRIETVLEGLANKIQQFNVKLDAAVMASGLNLKTIEQKARRIPTQDAPRVFNSLTIKQHAALQMILRGATDAEIGQRFGVSTNTAKVYVRSIAKRCGVNKRDQIVRLLAPIYDGIAPDEYVQVTQGLPKDWDDSWTPRHPANVLLTPRE